MNLSIQDKSSMIINPSYILFVSVLLMEINKLNSAISTPQDGNNKSRAQDDRVDTQVPGNGGIGR